MRIGTKKRPFYRVVAVDERNKRTGAYLELLGTYNPLTEPHEIKLKQDRIDFWVKQGAQMSDGFLRIIGKAPQRPPRKPKKEKKAEAPAKEAVAVEEQASTPEAPTEQPVEATTEPAATPDEPETAAETEVTEQSEVKQASAEEVSENKES